MTVVGCNNSVGYAYIQSSMFESIQLSPSALVLGSRWIPPHQHLGALGSTPLSHSCVMTNCQCFGSCSAGSHCSVESLGPIVVQLAIHKATLLLATLANNRAASCTYDKIVTQLCVASNSCL